MPSHPTSSPSTPRSPGAAEQVDTYCRLFPDERERVAPLLRALASGQDIESRSNASGHLAASAIVLGSGRLLTIHHPYLQRWIQPGGHLEPGERPEEAALREFLEETGACARLHPWHTAHRCPVDIDVHGIPASPSRQEAAHLHFDLRYLLTCSSPPTDEAELRSRWTPRTELADPGLQALMEKLRALHIPGASI